MIGLALGALFRNTASGISTFAGVFFVLPLLSKLLPASWSSHFGQYLPSNAGGVLYGGTNGLAHQLTERLPQRRPRPPLQPTAGTTEQDDRFGRPGGTGRRDSIVREPIRCWAGPFGAREADEAARGPGRHRPL